MRRDEWDDDGRSESLPPLVLRRAIADALASRLPLAAGAVLAGRLDAEQLYALEEGVQALVRDGHGADVAAALERRIVDLARACPGADLAPSVAEFRAALAPSVAEFRAALAPVEIAPLGAEPLEAEPVRVELVGAEPVGAESVAVEPAGADPVGIASVEDAGADGGAGTGFGGRIGVQCGPVVDFPAAGPEPRSETAAVAARVAAVGHGCVRSSRRASEVTVGTSDQRCGDRPGRGPDDGAVGADGSRRSPVSREAPSWDSGARARPRSLSTSARRGRVTGRWRGSRAAAARDPPGPPRSSTATGVEPAPARGPLRARA